MIGSMLAPGSRGKLVGTIPASSGGGGSFFAKPFNLMAKRTSDFSRPASPVFKSRFLWNI